MGSYNELHRPIRLCGPIALAVVPLWESLDAPTRNITQCLHSCLPQLHPRARWRKHILHDGNT